MCTFLAKFAFDKATNGQTLNSLYKTQNVVNTYLNVTFEDRRSNAPTLRYNKGHYIGYKISKFF